MSVTQPRTTAARQATTKRVTKETSITVTVNLDGPADQNVIETPVPFFTHMLDAFACHGRIGLNVQAAGDIEVDPHHLIEDVGIVLGETIFKALGGLKGIERAGFFTYPMDGSLATVAIDLCGRRNLTWNVEFSPFPIGTLNPNLFREFYKGLVDGMRATVHVNVHYQDNDHHAIEAVMKALGRALRQATTPLSGVEYLSTKGTLDEN
jgi:imidazoleglycerol-phosphate dehydratase